MTDNSLRQDVNPLPQVRVRRVTITMSRFGSHTGKKNINIDPTHMHTQRHMCPYKVKTIFKLYKHKSLIVIAKNGGQSHSVDKGSITLYLLREQLSTHDQTTAWHD